MVCKDISQEREGNKDSLFNIWGKQQDWFIEEDWWPLFEDFW